MLFPLKFVAANIFMAGVTAGAVGGAAAVFLLSDQQRRDKLKDCAVKGECGRQRHENRASHAARVKTPEANRQV